MNLNGAVMLNAATEIVTDEQRYIAEIIKEYDPYLELQYIPPDQRGPNDKTFAVIHRPPGKPPYFVFYADECDYRILERLWASDNQHNDVVANMDAKNAALQAINYKKQMEADLEADDILYHALKKNGTYRYRNPHTGELVTIKD